MKKPTLSEIKRENEGFVEPEIHYLLDLVSRMGKALKHYDGIGRDCTGCEEARALIEEIKL